jgi:hypothetical protein
MEFPSDKPEFFFEFVRRTRSVVEEYSGEYEATLLANCLLGLLVVPKEHLFDRIPNEPLDRFPAWGVPPEAIQSPGRCDFGETHDMNLRQLMKSLRHAVAHFAVSPLNEDGQSVGFIFKNRNGFELTLRLDQMRKLAIQLAEHLEQQLDPNQHIQRTGSAGR